MAKNDTCFFLPENIRFLLVMRVHQYKILQVLKFHKFFLLNCHLSQFFIDNSKFKTHFLSSKKKWNKYFFSLTKIWIPNKTLSKIDFSQKKMIVLLGSKKYHLQFFKLKLTLTSREYCFSVCIVFWVPTVTRKA